MLNSFIDFLSAVNSDLDYLTPDFSRRDCGIFGATLSDHDRDRIISQVHHLHAQAA